MAFPSRTLLLLCLASAGLLTLARTRLPHPSLTVHASTRLDQTAGQGLFHERGCEHCHGTEGIGGEKGPSLSGVGRKWKPAQIEKQILSGGGGMPAFADALSPDDVRLLVDYLAAKKKVVRNRAQAPAKPAVPAPQSTSGGSSDQ